MRVKEPTQVFSPLIQSVMHYHSHVTGLGLPSPYCFQNMLRLRGDVHNPGSEQASLLHPVWCR